MEMTRDEAIWWLRKYRRGIPKYNYNYGVLRNNPDFLYQSFEQHLVKEAIDRIESQPDKSPTEVIWELYSMLDQVLAESDDDHLITHNYASMMELIARDMLRYLREKEIRKHEQN